MKKYPIFIHRIPLFIYLYSFIFIHNSYISSIVLCFLAIANIINTSPIIVPHRLYIIFPYSEKIETSYLLRQISYFFPYLILLIFMLFYLLNL